jgi:hypothetical protein
MQGLSERQYAAHVGLSRGAIQMRIPRHPAGDSTGIRPPIPRSSGHPRLRACGAVFHCGVFPRWSMTVS